MYIGNIAQASGLPAKTIRNDEEIGPIKPLRGANGYRAFRESHLHRLAFLARARSLGFSIEDCRALLSLYEDRGRASADVKHLPHDHIGRIEWKIIELKPVHRSLSDLVMRCHGDANPGCPIPDNLAGTGS
ncbi:MerR family DNA-binding protein [Pseudorhodobacter sp.]|uniref:MerR family DNA-binding protein n=1 Tax=Pseudorhodobacter sp. TaxID=1934400 RepID=UPI002648E0FC|nr:MerR family DNA-binding protein [Pseudorhodobacter sp.]MDN5787048.1 MerR family DNA-binding protein [Pseudorhodobacter sp.]